MGKSRIRYGKRNNSVNTDKCQDQEICLPNYLLDYFKGDLTLSEMELDLELGIKEWYILISNINLSRREQQCLIKYYWKGLTQDQIAKELNHNITRQAVALYLNNARKKISKYYKIDMNKFNNVKEILRGIRNAV